MATTLGDGPLGLEAAHRWQSGDGQTLSPDLGVEAATPRFKLDRIGGLHSLPEADDSRKPRVGYMGEVVYPGAPRGKTITYEGRIQATTLAQLRNMGNDLRAAFSERSREGLMHIIPHASYGTDEWSFIGRVMQLDMDEEQSFGQLHARGPYQRAFAVSIRMSDPRFIYKLRGFAGRQVVTGAPGATVSAPNNGTAPESPAFAIPSAGAVGVPGFSDITITHVTGSRSLIFNDLPGGLLSVDFGARTAIIDSGPPYGEQDAMAYLDLGASTLWDENVAALWPGANSYAVTGAGVDGNWTISYFHRSW